MMKRAFAIVASACLILADGVLDAYDARLDKTLEEMRYRKRLDDNLLPPATKGKLEELQIFVRPPKNLKGPTQTFAWTVIEPGRFDLENSFIDEVKEESLHILVRVKKPKAPASNKKGAATKEAVPRVTSRPKSSSWSRASTVPTSRPRNSSPTSNPTGTGRTTSKPRPWTLTAKEVQIYLYGDKNGPYEIALIFDYPKDSKKSIDAKIRLSLEAFAVGEAARHAFNSGGEEEGGEEGGGVAPPI